MKKRNQARDEIRAVRAALREEEIREHGRPVNRPCVRRNRKRYTRKRKHPLYDEYNDNIRYEDIQDR